MLAESELADAQDRFVSSVKGMLARPDYLVPLAAAERQFRDHYYGLNSAALLEDLFFDALGSFLRQTQPTADLVRPPTGQKGWDYSYDGLQISHKVSQGLGDVAALWDATKQGVTEWSFEEPIVYVLGSNAPSTSIRVHVDTNTNLSCRAVADVKRPYLADGRAVLVVRWPAIHGQPELLEIIASKKGQGVAENLPFSHIWAHVAGHVKNGGAANEIDVLVTNRACPEMLVEAVNRSGTPRPIDVEVGLRGGVYLLRNELLQDLPVTTNNRAILIPKATIKLLLEEAALRGLFAPLPLWYWVYAQERPPDMYSAQRAEYDSRFSARGDLDAK
jgi:hypothetical protein